MAELGCYAQYKCVSIRSSRPLRCSHVRFIVATSSSTVTSCHSVAVDLSLAMVQQPHTAVPFLHGVP